MNIKALAPGVYKIRKQDYAMAFGTKHPRENPNVVHLLRVVNDGKLLRYYLDHDVLGARPEELDIADYELISHYEDGAPKIRKCAITLSFEDEAGQKFSFKVSDAWSLRNIFDSIPWLRKPFGYEAKKSKK